MSIECYAVTQSNKVPIYLNANNPHLSNLLVDSSYPNFTILMRPDIPEAILVAHGRNKHSWFKVQFQAYFSFWRRIQW